MNAELLRIIETIHREKDIDKEALFQAIEAALLTVAKRKKGDPETGCLSVKIDRKTGETIGLDKDNQSIPLNFGRIGAQTVKQLITQKIREAERDSIFEEFESRKGDIITGNVSSFEKGDIFVNLGRVEGILPKKEQVRGETFHENYRIRALILDVKKAGQKVKILLSRSHTDFVKRLFELEVPEIPEKIIEIKKVVREAGYRTKVAVHSNDPRVDCVGACVGVRGTRIKNIIDELNGEKIDIIRWNEAPEIFIKEALKPAKVNTIILNIETREAKVIVDDMELSLAIGKRGQNVRLASQLCEWELNVTSEKEEEEARKEVQESGEEGTPQEPRSEAGEAPGLEPPAKDKEGAEDVAEEEPGKLAERGEKEEEDEKKGNEISGPAES